MEKKTVLVAMSGGVDSSVAAALLVREGHRVIGVTMKTFCYQEAEAELTGPTRSCCGLDGIMDARAVANRLGIPHYVFDVEREFTRDVIDDFVQEYAAGRTPNPCVRCNGNTKFRDLLRRGKMLGCDAIATGHYARIGADEAGRPVLLRGVDANKDQSYFLWALPPELLSQLIFLLLENTVDGCLKDTWFPPMLDLKVNHRRPQGCWWLVQELCFLEVLLLYRFAKVILENTAHPVSGRTDHNITQADVTVGRIWRTATDADHQSNSDIREAAQQIWYDDYCRRRTV